MMRSTFTIQRRIAVVSVGLAMLAGCGVTAKEVGERAFVEAVNLKCRNDKARFKLAKRVAEELAATPKGQELQSDAQKRLDDLGSQWSDISKTVKDLKGPKVVEDALNEAAQALKSLPGEVADKTITPQEAKDKLEATRADLRARGFVDCV